MRSINFKPVYLTKLITRLIVLGIMIAAVIFLKFNMETEFAYCLSMFIFFVGVLIVFYLNQLHPERIDLDIDQLTIIYFNKMFFKIPPRTLATNSIKLINLKDRYLLISQNETIAKISVGAIEETELQILAKMIMQI
ncbi:hypothetical protein FFF34_000440 [Inquilinus sp. KBS0705]|nr:hypothetical protein FFF34_000440 [Inquilinus sp. KBS0705]